MKKIYFIILLTLFIVSCETREDINMKRNTSPHVYIGMNEKDINVIELSDTLRKSDSSTYYFRSVDDSDLINYTFELEFLEDNSIIKDSVVVEINEQTKELHLKCNLNDKTINNISYNFNIYIVATDNYNLSEKAKISITLIENRPPVPQVSFSNISSTEYEISAMDSYDKDGDAIVAYEYLIDGEVLYNKPGYEDEYETSANPNPGHAGTEGTYIISTPLGSIKHNFQVENVNDFKIYVRVKDERGLWSSWSQFSL